MTNTSSLRRAAFIASGVALLLPVGSLLASPFVPLSLRVLVIALWLTAVIRPHAALVALALIAPFGASLLSAFGSPPVSYTEALVLVVLSGACFALARPAVGQAVNSPSLIPPVIVFSGAIVCSLAVVLAVSQIGVGVRLAFARTVAMLVVRDYLVSPPGQWAYVTAAARLIEGVLLLLAVSFWTRQSERQSTRLMLVVAATGVIASVMSTLQLTALTRDVETLRDFTSRLLTLRIGAHVADANAAGSWFAMAAFITLAFALRESTRKPLRIVWGLTAAVVVAAMFLTGSRSALLAFVAVLVPAAIWVGRVASGRWLRWSIAAAVVAAIAGAVAVGFDPRAIARRSLTDSLDQRAAFVMTGLRMIRQAPVFGVGIGRYFESSGGFMPQSIYWFFFHENAHNNFLQIGGELGLTGLFAFLWLLGVAAVRTARGVIARPADRLLAGALAGLAAFMVTWMAGHPLLTPEVAFPFWMLAGVAVARADFNLGAAVADPGLGEPAPAFNNATRVVVLVALLVLAASVPFRASRDARALSLAEQSFGFYDWEGGATGRFRWTSPNAAFFVPGHADMLNLPICAAWSDKRPGTTVVTIRVDGRVLQKLGLTTGDWVDVPLQLPPSSSRDRYRRIDIVTEPPWSPAAVLGTLDSRVLGVQVGEVTVK